MSENWLKEYGFNPLRLPRRDLRPLDVLRMGHDQTFSTKAGTLDMLLSGDGPAPEVVVGEPTGGIAAQQTRKVEGRFGLSVLGALLGGLVGGKLGASTQLGKAKTVDVTYEEVTLDSVAELAIQGWIEAAQIAAPRSARADLEAGRFAVVTAVLRSSKLTVAVGRNGDAGVTLDVPEITGIVAAEASVGMSRVDGSQVTFEGPEPITFGLQAFVLQYEGYLTLGLPTEARGETPRGFEQHAWTAGDEMDAVEDAPL